MRETHLLLKQIQELSLFESDNVAVLSVFFKLSSVSTEDKQFYGSSINKNIRRFNLVLLHSDCETKEVFDSAVFAGFCRCKIKRENFKFLMNFQLPIFSVFVVYACRQSTCIEKILSCSIFSLFAFFFISHWLSYGGENFLFLDILLLFCSLFFFGQRARYSAFFKLKIKCISLSSSREFVQIN